MANLINSAKRIVNFLTRSVWRVKDTEVSRGEYNRNYLLKVIYLSINRYVNDRVQMRAKALTYSTLFSIVPILALLFAIAKGFGFANLMESLLRKGIAVGGSTVDTILNFIDSYLEHAHSGIFIGVGLIVLLWSIISLTGNIEQSMNMIWGVRKQRSYFRKITDYFSMFLLLPIILICISGWSIFMSTIYENFEGLLFLSAFVNFVIKAAPYFLMGLIFTGMYIFFPNTKVLFRHAVVPGMLMGILFQAFFYFYINVQVNISAYNAIYGSFAAIPLILFFINVAWCIVLFGVELTYVSQNIRQYSFSEDVENVSSRFYDFTCILFMSLICKRFEEGGKPYSVNELAQQTDIPYRLAGQVMNELEDDGLICSVGDPDAKSDNFRYMPTQDINSLTVGYLLRTLDTSGSEDFKTDYSSKFSNQWLALMKSKESMYNTESEILLKDL